MLVAIIVIDSEPCRIIEVEKRKPGKHGSAKVRLVAIGILDEVKRNMVEQADNRVEVPIVDKRSGPFPSSANSMGTQTAAAVASFASITEGFG